MSASLLFRGIADWLLARALRDGELVDTVAELGRRLVEGGLPICRINVGGFLLHPVLGAQDINWDADTDTCYIQTVPRSFTGTAEFRNAPFYHLASEREGFRRYRLEDAEVRARYPLFEKLAAGGVTDYLAWFESYGRSTSFERLSLSPGMEGAIASFATRRIGGFTEQEVANLRWLSAPFALAIKVATERSLATALLECYLGRLSGREVLMGLVERGDAREIECVLWLSDLRGSTKLAAELDMESYFATINDYFDCTAGAVLDHGGEVLKFIGDAVMAIFPIDGSRRPAGEMARAAVMTAREALSRAAASNATRLEHGLPPFALGIGLHAGKVMYGNVGTRQRLDLTVTGPAANEVQRLEGLCKPLSVPVVASGRFAAACEDALRSLGNHRLAGIAGELEVFTLPEFAATSPQAPQRAQRKGAGKSPPPATS